MIVSAIARLLAWLLRKPRRPPAHMTSCGGEARYRLHVPRSVLRELRATVRPNAQRGEPLSFLCVRYASEDSRTVIVGIGIEPFPETAYVDGPAGANFDTGWAVEFANGQINANEGLMLVHLHGGNGVPTFSGIDARTNRDVMASLSVGIDTAPYGALVLSDTDARCVVAAGCTLKDVRVVVVPDRFAEVTI